MKLTNQPINRKSMNSNYSADGQLKNVYWMTNKKI